MRVLKFILATILFVCSVWLSLVLGGGSLIKALSNYLYDETFIITNVKVSPKLNVTVDRIDFNMFHPKTNQKIFGFSRGVKLNWTFITGRLGLRLHLGPTVVDGFAKAKKSSVLIFPSDNYQLSNLKVEGEVENPSLDGVGDIGRLVLSGHLDLNKLVLSNLAVQIQGPLSYYNNDASIENTTGLISHLELTTPLNTQTNEFKIFVDELSFEESGFEVSSLNLKINNDFGAVSHSIQIESAGLNNNSFRLNHVNLQAQTDLVGNMLQPISISVEEQYIADPKMSFSATSLNINSENEKVRLTINSEIHQAELKIGTSYIGQIKTGNISSTIYMIDNGHSLLFTGEGVVLTKDEPSIISSLKSEIKLNFSNGPFDCFRGLCQLDKLNVDYNVEVGSAAVDGKLFCANKDCLNKKFSHHAISKNTSQFFNSIGAANILSPMVVMAIYNYFLAGEASGGGHIVNF